MSDLFMDMHRRRWHIPQTPPTSTTPSSSQHTDDNSFTHLNQQKNNHNNINGAPCKTPCNANDKGEEFYGDGDDDITPNILSLKLRKPKHWKWELSTSKSCSNIALPRILLYDHKGELLVDAQGEDEHVYKQEDYEKPKRDKSKKRSRHHQQQEQQQYHRERSATTNLMHSIRKALEKEFNGLQIQEATPSPEPTSLDSHTYNSQRSHSSRSRKAIELNTTDLPDYSSLSRRSSSLRGVRFVVDENDNDGDYVQHTVSQIPEFLPTPPSTTTTPTSSSSGPREKRKYRRSHSSGRSSGNSESILERFSYQKGRFSSPEYVEHHQVQHAPRYFLRTSKAGTLVVQEDSFSRHPLRRRRRPQKNQSTESLQNVQKFSATTSPTTQLSANNSPTPSERRRKKLQPIRRYMSDGNILINKQLSTSEEDVAAVDGGHKQLLDNVSLRQIRKYSNARNQNKVLTLILSVFYTLTILLAVESATIRSTTSNSNRNPVVYRRYIRRRPPMQPNDQYIDEVVEIFHTKRRPPSTVNIMTDEDVDIFIFCDFNRELEECKQYWESRRPKTPMATTTKNPNKLESTTFKAPTTVRPLESTTIADTTSTTTTTTTASPTIVHLPLLPHLPETVDETDLDDYAEEAQYTPKNEVESINENKAENDEEEYVEEDEDDYTNNYENNDVI